MRAGNLMPAHARTAFDLAAPLAWRYLCSPAAATRVAQVAACEGSRHVRSPRHRTVVLNSLAGRNVKLGIFLPNWIGDVVMATPTLRALRNHFGQQSRMVGIMRPYVSEVLAGTSWLDDQIFCSPRSKDPELRGWRLWRRMRQEKFDVAILMTNSFRTALWSRISGAPERVGYVPRTALDPADAPPEAGDDRPQVRADSDARFLPGAGLRGRLPDRVAADGIGDAAKGRSGGGLRLATLNIGQQPVVVLELRRRVRRIETLAAGILWRVGPDESPRIGDTWSW